VDAGPFGLRRRHDLREGQAREQHGDGHGKARQRPRRPDVDEGVAVGDRGFHGDEGPEGPDEGGARDEVREADIHAVPAGGCPVAHLVTAQDEQQRKRKGDALPEFRGVLDGIHAGLQGTGQQGRQNRHGKEHRRD